MSFNLGTFLFQLVNFIVLVYILHRLLYRPLHDAVDRRAGEIARARAEAEAAHQEARAVEQRLETRLGEIERERQDTLRQARAQAEAERGKILSEADQAVKRRHAELDQELERDRAEAVRALEAELVASAVGIADRLLRTAAGRSLDERLMERLVETLRDLPQDDRERLRHDGCSEDAAVVETAAGGNGPILKQLEATLADLTGRPVALTVRTVPELIGGARLRLGGHVWDATLADRLAEARQAQAVPEGNHP
jgi:F-type H+-transporting ATPase subunit b